MNWWERKNHKISDELLDVVNTGMDRKRCWCIRLVCRYRSDVLNAYHISLVWNASCTGVLESAHSFPCRSVSSSLLVRLTITKSLELHIPKSLQAEITRQVEDSTQVLDKWLCVTYPSTDINTDEANFCSKSIPITQCFKTSSGGTERSADQPSGVAGSAAVCHAKDSQLSPF